MYDFNKRREQFDRDFRRTERFITVVNSFVFIFIILGLLGGVYALFRLLPVVEALLQTLMKALGA